MLYKKINVELIVVADEADAVVAELNAALDRLEERQTLFGGGIETVAFFRVSHVGVGEFLFGTVLRPEGNPPRYGILPLAWGTFVIAAGSSLIALPVGLLSAIYLSEYAPRRVRGVLKPTLELLAGIPTIVYGYLALLLVTPTLKRAFEPLAIRVETFNALSACIVVGVMIIPDCASSATAWSPSAIQPMACRTSGVLRGLRQVDRTTSPTLRARSPSAFCAQAVAEPATGMEAMSARPRMRT